VSVRLDEIVARFGGRLVGDGGVAVDGIGTLEAAGPRQVSFLANPKYRSKLAATKAAAVIVAPDMAGACPTAAIVTAQPYLYFARVSQWLGAPARPAPGIHATSVVESVVPASAHVGAHAWIAPGVRLGEDVVIEANSSIGAGVEIGDGCWLHANVAVYSGCRIGKRAIVHSGAVIGADGFGFAREDTGAWVKIAQAGRVVIGDDVEIGAGTTIDRGALDDTVIGDGVKLDNQIQIGHNVRVGEHTAMAGCVGIAGSAVIGRRCTVGAGSMILGHLAVADDVNVSAGTFVGKPVTQPGTYTGMVPFMARGEWLKNFAKLRHLDAMADRIRALEARLAALEQGHQP
jgi:UDP-3-O-[3-hydroxymyristoyl] glucosamine N-acyltransferase